MKVRAVHACAANALKQYEEQDLLVYFEQNEVEIAFQDVVA